MMPKKNIIKLDLRDLTPAHLEEAKPHMGKCRYHSPCIIGSLIPAEQRRMRSIKQTHDLSQQPFEFPAGQWLDAQCLQNAFDERDWDRVLRLAEPYLNTTKEDA